MTFKQLYSGRKFYALDPRPEDINLTDIAWALSNVCRYGGHTRFAYSVAQHSVIMSWFCDPKDALAVLLHDAKEAYSPFGDVCSPDKMAINQRHPDVGSVMRMIDYNIERCIAERFRLPFPVKNQAVAELDKRILHNEMRDVMVQAGHKWDLPDVSPLGVRIEPWPQIRAFDEYLRATREAFSWHVKINGWKEAAACG